MCWTCWDKHLLQNGFLFFITLLTGSSLVSCEKATPPQHLPSYPIGHIPFSEKLDDPAFQLCNEASILETGGSSPSYKGGIKALNRYFSEPLDDLPLQKGENGFLTVRFLMNCKGQPGRFRLLAINERYKPKEFPNAISNLLLELVKKAPDWQVGVHQGSQYDSYHMLTFKIVDGQVVDIIL